MMPTLRQRDNWTRIRGHLVEDPQMTGSDPGSESCSLVVRSEASVIAIRSTGRAARVAAALNRGAQVEIVGSVVTEARADGEAAWSGVHAAAIRPRRHAAGGLVARVKRLGALLGAVLMLTVWPGGFVLTGLIAAAAWGAWNGGLIFARPRLSPLPFGRCVRYVSAVLVALETLEIVAH